MSDPRAGSRWRRILGTVLFDASLAVAALGIVRSVIGFKIDLGPRFPLEFAGSWSPFIVAGVLFAIAASIRPGSTVNTHPNDPVIDGLNGASEQSALGAGPAETLRGSPDATPGGREPIRRQAASVVAARHEPSTNVHREN